MRKKIHPWFLWGVIGLFSSIAYAEEKTLPKPIFKLTKGQGTEVCEAYLQRLNATEFVDNDPIKGRITEPLLKGFVDLKPVPLTEKEINAISAKMYGFDAYQEQYSHEKLLQSEKSSIITTILEKKPYTLNIRYQIKLNLDNDGIADDVVIQNSHGVYIVDKSLKFINEAKMKRIFANQEALEWPTLYQFPSLASPLTVFGYQKKYYFAGFFNNLGLYPYIRLSKYIDAPYLFGVFIHEKQNTRRICDYKWMNVAW